jgi:hypothetical protein
MKDVGFKTYSKLFHSGVTPILDYCSGIWGFNSFKSIDDVQNRAIRYFMGVHRFCPLPAIEGDMGWQTSLVRRHIEIIRLWNRILDMPDTRLPKIVLEYNFDAGSQTNNWLVDLQKILSAANADNYILAKCKVDIEMITTQLCNNQLVSWNEIRHQKTKLRYYNIFKADIETEHYILANLSKRVRAIYAQFRSGILPLGIETGRFQNINLEDRLCLYCSEQGRQNIEDEFHFLCECSNYQEERLILFRKVCLKHSEFQQLDTIDKFIFLNVNAQVQTASFICKAFDKRRKYVYR